MDERRPFRMLLVGDPHAAVEELEDCRRLLARIEFVAAAEHPDAIVFLGDQHHTHAVVRVEVLDFWSKALKRLAEVTTAKIYMLVGNHDRSHDSGITAHGLRYADSGCVIVDGPVWASPGVLLLPWYATQERFLAEAQDAPADLLICHQTFDGSKYENGFYAPDGIDAKLVRAPMIISGHIHTPQEFGKVWYPGAPRWRIATDANTDRNIWLYEHYRDGAPVRRGWPTSGYCRALYHVVDVEGQELPEPEVQEPARITVDVHGSSDYVKARLAFWKARGALPRGFSTREVKSRVRESDGIVKALQKYVETWKSRHGTDTEVLKKMVGDRIHV